MAHHPQNPNAGKLPPTVLPLHLSTEEASLILNKLNVADFRGFNEATIALSILGKIQSAPRLPASSIGPTTEEMQRPPVAKEAINNILDPPKFKPAPSVPTPPTPKTPTPPEKKESKVVAEVKSQTVIKDESAIDESPGKTPPEPDAPKEVLSESVEEDTRPTAPMTSLDQIRAGKNKENAEEDVPPPDEDAGVFSVIDRSTKMSRTAEDDYV